MLQFMKTILITFSFLIITILNLSAQTQIKIDKNTIDIIEGRENPKSADSAAQNYFDKTLEKFNIEYNDDNGFCFFPVGKRSSKFMFDANRNIWIDYPNYHLISKDSSIIIAIKWFDIDRSSTFTVKGYKYPGDYNDNLFKNITFISHIIRKEVKITERKTEPNYAYFNADRIGDFQIMPTEPLYFYKYKYLNSYYILKKDIGYFMIYKFVKDDYAPTSPDLDIPKLFKFK